MQEAALPADEIPRLQALHELEILDTLPERAYDDITYIASQLCSTPIALVSLVDADRQWFKSRVGLDPVETPRAMAFCSHAILEPAQVFEIPDTHRDTRFSDNPLVTGDPRIRFYAGAPLVTSDGHALGTLCVIDREPRQLSDTERAALRALSRQVVALLELRRAHQLLAHQAQQVETSRDELGSLCRTLGGQVESIERDLRQAEIIQRSLLPQVAPQLSGFCTRSLYRPGHTIGGDLYDVQVLSDRHVALVIADAVGHGVSAAMLSMLFKHRLRLVDQATGVPLAPRAALAEINAALLSDVPAPGVFVTAVCAVLDTRQRTLRLASAGHPPVLLMREDGRTEQLDRTGPALGLYPDARYLEHAVHLDEGDRLLLYTDGLFSGNNESPEKIEEIADRLRASQHGDKALESVLEDVCGTEARDDRDDVTMLLLEARSGESRFAEAPTAPTSPRSSVGDDSPILFAETPEGSYLALRGRITWLHGSGLLQAASSIIQAQRALCLDLRECEYLDSTLLGTLHEVAVRADDAGVPLRLHGARHELREAFEELDMEAVIAHLDNAPVHQPESLQPLPAAEPDVRRQQLRLLHAHEVLADLSEKNRDEFAELIGSLRRGLESS